MTKCTLRKRDGRCVQYLDENGKWKTTGCNSISQARAWYYRNFVNSKIKFKDFAKDFFSDKSVTSFYYLCIKTNKIREPAWWENNTYYLNCYYIPFFGDMAIEDITAPMIQDWYLSLEGSQKKELSDGSKQKILSGLSIILDHAVFKGIISSNPCLKVMKITCSYNEREIFSKEELEMMFPDDIDEMIRIWRSINFAGFFLVMADTGWRPSEVAGTTVGNFYPELNGIYTMQSIDLKKRVVKQRVKTSDKGYKYRVGKISDKACKVIDLILSQRDSICPSDLIFLKEDGNPIDSYTMARRYNRAMKILGLSTENRTPYSLRTTFFTEMTKTYSDEIAMELMGHKKWHTCYDKKTPIDVIKKINRLMSLEAKN